MNIKDPVTGLTMDETTYPKAQELVRALSCKRQSDGSVKIMTNREAHEEAAGMNLDDSFFKKSKIDPDATFGTFEGTWIMFEPLLQLPKTKRWKVRPKKQERSVGMIRWFSPFRKYCFFPNEEMVFEQVCLREIADFCERATNEHLKPNATGELRENGTEH